MEMTDRTIKCLLAATAFGLGVCALRPWIGSTPALAQGDTQGFSHPVAGFPPANDVPIPVHSEVPALSVSQGGIAYVVSGGYISAYVVDGHPQQLRKIGQQLLPALPSTQPPNGSPFGGSSKPPYGGNF